VFRRRRDLYRLYRRPAKTAGMANAIAVHFNNSLPITARDTDDTI
jgi:hypothetical protein